MIYTSLFGDSKENDSKKPADKKLLKYSEEYIIMDNAQDIAFSTRDVFILRTDGTLWAFDSNDQGQIGDGNKYFTLRQIYSGK